MLIKVTSPSFSNNELLRQELFALFPSSKFNNKKSNFTKTELIEFIHDSDGLIVGLDTIDKYVIDHCNKLKIIAKYGVGLDNIDTEYCKERKIEICWTPGTNKLSVAEQTIGFMLALARNLFITSNTLKQGIWNKDGGCQLSNKTIGIIGVGNIGKEVIRLLKPFNCIILVNDIINQDGYYQSEGLIISTKEEIYQKADIISIHTPLTIKTKYLLNKRAFELMKSSAFVINTARGNIINEADLKWALINKKIASAAIDVYEKEPPEDTELLNLSNLICTPHIGGNSHEAVLLMGRTAINHLKKYSQKM